MTLNEQLERLAAFDRVPHPVVSLYLNTGPDQRGRDHFQTFVRKELKARAATYPPRSADRESLDRDFDRIVRFLETGLRPSANAVAIFACDAAGFFETLQLDAPLDDHSLVIADQPHLYPLARLAGKYPRYAAVLADTHRARILVVGLGGIEEERDVTGVKTRWTKQGATAQARYQRHIENFHLHHAKEVVAVLERIVLKDAIETIVVLGDEVVIPLLRAQMPKALAAKVVDELPLAFGAPDREIIAATLESMRKHHLRTDREKVDAAVGAFRASGLGVVGPDATLLALTNGQVDELLLSESLGALAALRRTPAAEMAIANDSGFVRPAVELAVAGEPAQARIETVRLADELVMKAEQTGAKICFIDDNSLLEPYGGVAATLRYRI